MANKGSRGRSPLFYELIKNLDKVKFVGFEENSLELIKHSIFVSTISGSVALEASVIGKKSLIFGDIWFKGCPNVFSWSNNLTYDQIIKSETFGHEDVLKFLKKKKRRTLQLQDVKILVDKIDINILKKMTFLRKR